MALAVGTQLAQYRVLNEIGKGGMGEVYRALDTNLGREVAIKILPEHIADSPSALHRFKNEARALAALSHPNILAIHDFCKEDGIFFAVMELLQGETLRKSISQNRLSWQDAVEIAISVGLGLAAAHSKKIVHRDLKPENIFLTSDGTVKILDFGLAKVIQEMGASHLSDAVTKTKDTVPGNLVGTIQYMSPEQLREESIDARTDIFSLGCVLYEMLTGARPFSRNTIPETISAILNDDPPSLDNSKSEIPRPLAKAVECCLPKNPANRFQSAQDLVAVLKSVLDNGGKKEISRSRSLIWAGLAFTLLLVMLFGVNQLFSRKRVLSSTETSSHPEAYQAYIKGRNLLDRLEAPAFDFFEQAIAKKPDYAEAYAGLADSWVLFSIWDNLFFEQREVYLKAKESALKAVELNESSVEAHTSLAMVDFFYEWDYSKAEKEWKKAFEINPDYDLAHETYAFYLAAVGRFDEAWQQIQIPLSRNPLSSKVHARAGFVLFLRKDFNGAVKYYQKAFELDPSRRWGRDTLTEIYIKERLDKKAFLNIMEGLRLDPQIASDEINEVQSSYRTGGIQGILRSRIERYSFFTHSPSFTIASDYALLNEKQKAIEWLQKMYRDRHGGTVFIKVDPVFEVLHDEPDYQDIVQRMNFPK